jgi:hypothetical protein
MVDPRTEYTRKAVAVMTAYLEPPGGASQLVNDLINDSTAAGIEEADRLVRGFVNLSAYLLITLERDAGRDPQSVLREVAAYGF